MVSSATCAEALFAVLHTACRLITQPCASAVGATGPEWQPATNHSLPFSSHVSVLPFFVPFLVPVLKVKESTRCTDLLVYQIAAVYVLGSW